MPAYRSLLSLVLVAIAAIAATANEGKEPHDAAIAHGRKDAWPDAEHDADLENAWKDLPFARRYPTRDARPGYVRLEDGAVFPGISFGFSGDDGGGGGSDGGGDVTVAGEVVFTTALVGYVESLTDPSYEGQILVATYPLIGNYGVPANASAPARSSGRGGGGFLPSLFEGRRVHARALLVANYEPDGEAHWEAALALGQWLRAQGVPALERVDTRALTKHLRRHGTMRGVLAIGGGGGGGDAAAPSGDGERHAASDARYGGPSQRFAEHFRTLGLRVGGTDPHRPSTPQIISQRLCI